MNSSSDFLNLAEGWVAGTTLAGTGTGMYYGWAGLTGATATGAYVDAGGSLILATGAGADILGLGFVGFAAGAGIGVTTLPVLAGGYYLGTLISPWVNQNIIDPLYPWFGLPEY